MERLSHASENPFSGTHFPLKSQKSLEERRGDIARTERSALAVEAQPYQDLLDRILYRMAGLTDAEAQGVGERVGRWCRMRTSGNAVLWHCWGDDPSAHHDQ